MINRLLDGKKRFKWKQRGQRFEIGSVIEKRVGKIIFEENKQERKMKVHQYYKMIFKQTQQALNVNPVFEFIRRIIIKLLVLFL